MAPASVYAALSEGSVAEVAPLLPGIAVNQSRPSENELLYTFPGQGGADPATLRFRFDPLDGGTATNVVATVNTPDVQAKIGGQMKVLSEVLVASQVRKLISSLDTGGTSPDQVSSLLIAIAVATNTEMLQKAMAMSFDQSGMLDALLADMEASVDRNPEVQDPNDPTEFATVEDGAEAVRREAELAAEEAGIEPTE